MALINRGYRQVERPWLEAYLMQRYPDARVVNPSMHAPADLAAAGKFGATPILFEMLLTLPNREAILRTKGRVSPRFASRIIAKIDAAVDLPNELQFWEAKQRPLFGAISQLEQYRQVWPLSVEHTLFEDKPLTLHLLSSIPAPHVAEIARQRAVEFVEFTTPELHAHQVASLASSVERRQAAFDKLRGGEGG